MARFMRPRPKVVRGRPELPIGSSPFLWIASMEATTKVSVEGPSKRRHSNPGDG